jgi:hypothetical protein
MYRGGTVAQMSPWKDPKIMVPALASILAAFIGVAGVVVGVVITRDHPSSEGASLILDLRPGIAFEGSSGGEEYSLAGSGFHADSSVWITVDGKHGQEAAVNADGAFSAQVILVPRLAEGQHTFVAKGQQSGVEVDRYLVVPPD